MQFKKIVLQLNLIKLKLVNSRIFVSFIIFSDTNLFIKGFQILWYKHLNKKMSCLYITCNVKIYNYSFINNIKVIEREKIVNFMNFMVHLFGFRVCKFNQKIAFFYQKKTWNYQITLNLYSVFFIIVLSILLYSIGYL